MSFWGAFSNIHFWLCPVFLSLSIEKLLGSLLPVIHHITITYQPFLSDKRSGLHCSFPCYFSIFWNEAASRASQVSATLVLVDWGLGRCLDTWNPHDTIASCSRARFTVCLGSLSLRSLVWPGRLSPAVILRCVPPTPGVPGDSLGTTPGNKGGGRQLEGCWGSPPSPETLYVFAFYTLSFYVRFSPRFCCEIFKHTGKLKEW